MPIAPPRRLALPLIALVACLQACAPKADDSAGAVDTHGNSDTNTFSCPSPAIHVNGSATIPAPAVGDVWNVLIWCDSTLLTGAMHVTVDPPTMATIDANNVTWAVPGSASLFVQDGTIQATEDVTVADAGTP